MSDTDAMSTAEVYQRDLVRGTIETLTPQEQLLYDGLGLMVPYSTLFAIAQEGSLAQIFGEPNATHLAAAARVVFADRLRVYEATQPTQTAADGTTVDELQSALGRVIRLQAFNLLARVSSRLLELHITLARWIYIRAKAEYDDTSKD